MLQINEYDLSNLESSLDKKIKKIDDEIKADLQKISKIKKLKSFFEELNKVVDLNSDFSFIKASQSFIENLKAINCSIVIDDNDIKDFNAKLSLSKSAFSKKTTNSKFTFNNIIEHIFGYHKEHRIQVLKKIIKSTNFDNCAYCLAQYTTSYESRKEKAKIYVKGNLDHIYPKSLNALVSLSINNLVPVCGHCNQRKLDADLKKFNFNPFQIIKKDEIPTFKFDEVLNINNGKVIFNDINNLKIENINTTLESRLEVTALYKEYKSPIVNLLDRYNKFNSSFYQAQIENLINNGISNNLEFFISETPYTEENIQNVPLHKFKSDFYKELEEYKKDGKVRFT